MFCSACQYHFVFFDFFPLSGRFTTGLWKTLWKLWKTPKSRRGWLTVTVGPLGLDGWSAKRGKIFSYARARYLSLMSFFSFFPFLIVIVGVVEIVEKYVFSFRDKVFFSTAGLWKNCGKFLGTVAAGAASRQFSTVSTGFPTALWKTAPSPGD